MTLALAKRPGANATALAEQALAKVDALRPKLLPADVRVDVTRNYGETAREKSNELVEHLLIATLSVVALVSLAMGWRSGVVVGIAVPVTLALNLFIYFLAGYTLNRVTLFALIFSIGILVDDAIVVVENIERHHREKPGRPLHADGGGGGGRGGQPHDPRHLHGDRGHPAHGVRARAFGSVHAPDPHRGVRRHALLPRRRLRGVPVGGPPDLPRPRVVREEGPAGGRGHAPLPAHDERAGEEADRRGSCSWPSCSSCSWGRSASWPSGAVRLKMMPFDNKSELQVLVDQDEGTPLEVTLETARRLRDHLVTLPEVKDVEVYAGTAAPFNFNGLVRHYFLRRAPSGADLQVNLVGKVGASACRATTSPRRSGPRCK